MEQKQRTFSVWYAVLVMLVLFGIQAILLAPHPENVSYSEFNALVTAGKVSDLVLYKDTIEGTLSPKGLEGVLSKNKIDEMKRSKEGVHRFVTTRVEDPGLVPELEAAHVRFTGHVENPWLATLLSWVVPAVVFFGLWMVLLKRMNPQSGPMALGKSRAKVYVEHQTGVTFDDIAGIDEAREELMEIVDFPLPGPRRPDQEHALRDLSAQSPISLRVLQSGGRRGRRPLLQPEWVGLRGDVRRGRGGARS